MDCESLIGLILLGMVMSRPTFHEKWDEILRTKSHTPTHIHFLWNVNNFPVPFKREASEGVSRSDLLGSELKNPPHPTFTFHEMWM